MAKKKTKARAAAKSKMSSKKEMSLGAAMASSATSKTSSTSNKTMSARQLTVTFVVWFIAHLVIFFLANKLFPQAVVLGTNIFSMWEALLYSMIVFTLITVGFIPVVEMISSSAKRTMSAMDWMVTYFVINTVAIWLVARFAEQLGMGISSWVVAVVLALIVDAVQGLLVTKAVN
jgi:hypothetical protein